MLERGCSDVSSTFLTLRLQTLAQAYARSLSDAPELADITAVGSNGQEGMDIDGGAASKGKKRKRIYEDHRPMSSIAAGIKQGTLHQVRMHARTCQSGMQVSTLCGSFFAACDKLVNAQMCRVSSTGPKEGSLPQLDMQPDLQACLMQGSLRVNRFNPYEGYVGSESVGQDILLAGRAAMNRALDGDIVALELLPEEQWASASSQLRKADDAAHDDKVWSRSN
jgi:exoribonuclease R